MSLNPLTVVAELKPFLALSSLGSSFSDVETELNFKEWYRIILQISTEVPSPLRSLHRGSLIKSAVLSASTDSTLHLEHLSMLETSSWAPLESEYPGRGPFLNYLFLLPWPDGSAS